LRCLSHHRRADHRKRDVRRHALVHPAREAVNELGSRSESDRWGQRCRTVTGLDRRKWKSSLSGITGALHDRKSGPNDREPGQPGAGRGLLRGSGLGRARFLRGRQGCCGRQWRSRSADGRQR
jgi:hypothetical protein